MSTGNSLDCIAPDLEAMHASETAVKDMESAAVAEVCRLWGTPMLAVKSVTDIVDGDKPTNEEFLANLHASSQALQDAISRILGFVDGKTLAQL